MDASALESAISALEIASNSLDNWLKFWIALVVVGVLIEVVVVIVVYRHELKAYRYTLLLPERPSFLLPALEFLGAALVAVGVAGEFGAHIQFGKLETDLRNKNRQLVGLAQTAAGKAIRRAGEANERASTNEKESARLHKKAEEERTARVNIEKQLAPRTLNDSDRKLLGEQLRRFSPSFSKRRVKLSSYSTDAEGIVFSLEILDVLTQAGIDVDPFIGRSLPVGLVDMGVKVTGPIADESFMRSLITGIKARVDTNLRAEWDPKYATVEILVGVKPVPGLPAVRRE